MEYNNEIRQKDTFWLTTQCPFGAVETINISTFHATLRNGFNHLSHRKIAPTRVETRPVVVGTKSCANCKFFRGNTHESGMLVTHCDYE